jgi:predicted O-linked N-acetylglucosamine transferase (SPINDLY family)
MIELCHDRFEVFLFLFTLKEKKRKEKENINIRCAKVELVEKE